MSSHENMSQPGPGAHEERTRLIVTWHARGQDALDSYGIPRFEDGIEYTIAERISLLAARGDVEAEPKREPDIHGAEES